MEQRRDGSWKRWSCGTMEQRRRGRMCDVTQHPDKPRAYGIALSQLSGKPPPKTCLPPGPGARHRQARVSPALGAVTPHAGPPNRAAAQEPRRCLPALGTRGCWLEGQTPKIQGCPLGALSGPVGGLGVALCRGWVTMGGRGFSHPGEQPQGPFQARVSPSTRFK